MREALYESPLGMRLRAGTVLLLSTVVEVSLGGFVPLRNADPFSNRPAALQKTRCHASRWAVRRRSLVSKMAAGEQPGRKKVAMFDATGTLIFLREPPGDTYYRLAEQHGLCVPVPTVLDQRFQEVVARKDAIDYSACRCETGRKQIEARERQWWWEVVAAVFGPEAVEHAAFGECFDALYAYFGSAHAWGVYPGVREVMQKLRGEGWHVGILSNFDSRLHSILAELELTCEVQWMVLPKDSGQIKPDTGAFLAALEAADAAPTAACMHVGDSVRDDVIGAVQAGIFAVLIDRRGKHAAGNAVGSFPPPPRARIVADFQQVRPASCQPFLLDRACADASCIVLCCDCRARPQTQRTRDGITMGRCDNSMRPPAPTLQPGRGRVAQAAPDRVRRRYTALLMAWTPAPTLTRRRDR